MRIVGEMPARPVSQRVLREHPRRLDGKPLITDAFEAAWLRSRRQGAAERATLQAIAGCGKRPPRLRARGSGLRAEADVSTVAWLNPLSSEPSALSHQECFSTLQEAPGHRSRAHQISGLAWNGSATP